MSDLMVIAGVAYDPGGARAILPVLARLSEEGKNVFALLAGPALSICQNEFPKLRYFSLDDEIAQEAIAAILQQEKARLLVSASGLYNQIEHTARLAAKKSGIRVVAVLDWWWCYKERFERVMPDGRVVQSRPDFVCALDEMTKKGLIQAGFSPEQIEVTGAPNLEWSQKKIQYHEHQRDVIRASLGVRSRQRCAVFFSEPYIKAADGLPWGGLGGYYNDDEEPIYGYTPHNMLWEVASALAELAKGEKVVLVVKPHPMEHIASLCSVIEQLKEQFDLEIVLSSEADPARLCVAGDFFFGMVSIVLLEAALTGKPVLSVQIGLDASQQEDACISNRLGLSKSILSLDNLKNAIAALNSSEKPNSGKLFPLCLGSTMLAAKFLEQKFLQ
jgi:hypothetical protein